MARSRKKRSTPRRRGDTGSTREAVLAFISERESQGRPATVREIADELQLSSPATVHRHLRNLEARGEVVRDPAGGSRSWRPRATAGGVPVVGRIAAGEPIENCLACGEPPESWLPLRSEALVGSGDLVALRVEGLSMREAGILPGDFAIIRCQPEVENGEVAAVTVDGEGTLKRWSKRGSEIRLEGANPQFPAIDLSDGKKAVEIFGRLVGVVRWLPSI